MVIVRYNTQDMCMIFPGGWVWGGGGGMYWSLDSKSSTRDLYTNICNII